MSLDTEKSDSASRSRIGKMTLRREDSGYSGLGTPTPGVTVARKFSRAEPSLQKVPEHHESQNNTELHLTHLESAYSCDNMRKTGRCSSEHLSCKILLQYLACVCQQCSKCSRRSLILAQHTTKCRKAGGACSVVGCSQYPPSLGSTAGEQAVVSRDEGSYKSVPLPPASGYRPTFVRTYSYDGYHTGGRLSGLNRHRLIKQQAEEIVKRAENYSDPLSVLADSMSSSSFSLHSSSPPQRQYSGNEEPMVQYPVPPDSGAGRVLQRQLSEFPLDQTVLTMGEDGNYLEDRDYYIGRDAGVGAFASCNHCRDMAKSEDFVVKRPKKSCSEAEEYEKQMQDMIRESRILKMIDHENVVRFFGAVEDTDCQSRDRTFKIFIESMMCGDVHQIFCESQDREDYSRNIVLIMLYTQQVLSAVNYLHQERGILHLDIKGKNIMACKDGFRVKLIDFGAACLARNAPVLQTGWTPVFAAPEINRQEDPKFSADIWSVLCVAVEMVTGCLPWSRVLGEDSNHNQAVFKVGFFDEESNLTELVPYDDYWKKFNYSEQHVDMYLELVRMWRQVFHKDSSQRPSAFNLLQRPWMRKMELEGEKMLQELVCGGSEELSQSSQSTDFEADRGIIINAPMETDDNIPLTSYGFRDDNVGSNHTSPVPFNYGAHMRLSPGGTFDSHMSAESDSGDGYYEYRSSSSNSFHESYHSMDQLGLSQDYRREQPHPLQPSPASLPSRKQWT